MATKLIQANKNPNHKVEESKAKTHYLLGIVKKGQFDAVTGKRRVPVRAQYFSKEQFEHSEHFGSFRLFDVEIYHDPTLPIKRATKKETTD